MHNIICALNIFYVFLYRSNYVKHIMHSKKVKLIKVLKYLGLISGYSFRGKIINDAKGNMRVIQLKDFTNNYTNIGDSCYFVDGSKIKDKYILNKGDILFIAKGANNFAVTFNPKDKIPTIASSALFVIRIDKTIANPYYIAWYINQPMVQNYLKQNELGSYIPSINKPTIEGIPLVLPSLKVQGKIALMAELQNREQELLTRIKNMRKIVVTQLLTNKINS